MPSASTRSGSSGPGAGAPAAAGRTAPAARRAGAAAVGDDDVARAVARGPARPAGGVDEDAVRRAQHAGHQVLAAGWVSCGTTLCARTTTACPGRDRAGRGAATDQREQRGHLAPGRRRRSPRGRSRAAWRRCATRTAAGPSAAGRTVSRERRQVLAAVRDRLLAGVQAVRVEARPGDQRDVVAGRRRARARSGVVCAGDATLVRVRGPTRATRTVSPGGGVRRTRRSRERTMRSARQRHASDDEACQEEQHGAGREVEGVCGPCPVTALTAADHDQPQRRAASAP
jgi:hypothetical protein